jgi:hypothetical protein
MPVGSTGHIGIQSIGANSPTFLNDLQFNGGAIGLSISDTQYQLKSMYFNGLRFSNFYMPQLMQDRHDYRHQSKTTAFGHWAGSPLRASDDWR